MPADGKPDVCNEGVTSHRRLRGSMAAKKESQLQREPGRVRNNEGKGVAEVPPTAHK
eukprot:CAMPEP_0177622984 /NCGR_PEP_ID=MMETSP0419_2-20121207/28650_1 /TAXON_ID=582737 /ORGANISM="Tetraselmis sp., Strain GSL018" /LENGTH=56 /DNA_ID=CAMNT_0019123485 /DNA_START=252 /DNA_END=423 /DNA_ORIENTATION=-